MPSTSPPPDARATVWWSMRLGLAFAVFILAFWLATSVMGEYLRASDLSLAAQLALVVACFAVPLLAVHVVNQAALGLERRARR